MLRLSARIRPERSIITSTTSSNSPSAQRRSSYLCGKNIFFITHSFTCREATNACQFSQIFELLVCTNTATSVLMTRSAQPYHHLVDDLWYAMISDFCAIKESSAANNLVRSNAPALSGISSNTEIAELVDRTRHVVRCTLIDTKFFSLRSPIHAGAARK